MWEGSCQETAAELDVWVSSGWPGGKAVSNVVPNEGELNHLYLVGGLSWSRWSVKRWLTRGLAGKGAAKGSGSCDNDA